jgi:hypothetical protein
MLLQFHLFLWETRLVRDFCRSIECLFLAFVRGHDDDCRDCDTYEGMWW